MSHRATAQVILDSISPEGHRLTSFQLRYWRPIHSELMTHRVFSRNDDYSRARPSAKIIEQVLTAPWGPIHWGKNEPGIQANQEITGFLLQKAKLQWRAAAISAAGHAESFLKAGLHKQIVNRLLEPFTYIDVVVTATEYNNWFALRDHPDAQPEIQDLARRMKTAMNASIPKLLQPGEWHLPYITDEDSKNAAHYLHKKNGNPYFVPHSNQVLELLKKISVARCARVSYKAFDGNVAPIEKDLELYQQLLVSEPLHASPAEHQATPDEKHWIQSIAVASPEEYEAGDDDENVLDTSEQWKNPHLHGNFTGWIQYRKTLPNEFVSG